MDAPVDSQELVIPIWGAEALAERPHSAVLITSRAMAALAAADYFPAYVCIAGHPKSDWEGVKEIKGRQVHLFPDAGEASLAQMREVAEILKPLASAITLHKQNGQAAGWNLHHAREAGWTKDQVTAYIKRDESANAICIKASKKVRAEKPAIEAESAQPLQEDIHLARDHLGRAHSTEANAFEVLSKHERFKGRLWLDEFAQRLMIDEVRFDRDRHGVEALMWMQTNLDMHKMPLTAVARAADHVGRQNSRHPLKAALESVEWDGAERLPGFMSNVYGAERNEYSEAVGRCWLISAIARVYSPGCKADYMLVLEGGQGIHKSTSLSILGGDWFIESHEDPIHNRKDFLGQLQGHWIIEIPEMHSIAGNVNGIEKIKGMISCQVDDYRKPYGATNMTHPRQCVFAGTTNLRQWNGDQTGGRRFWPIQCERIDLDYLRENRDQLLAEALAAYKARQPWWDVPFDEARAEQEERRHSDVWEPLIEKYMTHIPTYHEDGSCTWEPRMRPLEFVQVHRVLLEAIHKPLAQCTRSDQMRVASALGVMGYRRQHSSIDGVRAWVYRPTTATPVAAQPVRTPPMSTVDFDDVPY